MRIKYLGKVSVNDIFNCQICRQIGKEKYIATPDMPKLVDWKELIVCKKCARREVGSKNKAKWEKLHANA